MNIIPYGKQNITDEDILEVIKVLRSPLITQGPVVPKFEKVLSLKVESSNCVVVNSATSALHLACLSLGLRKNDWLWSSPITFVASLNCARYCGANVDFIDIDPSTGLISIEELKIKLEKASNQGKLPKIIIPVHLGGSCCEMQSIAELSKVYGFKIIEDASHAIGGKYKDYPIGNCKYSDITVFSFHPVKIITTGEGGAATTNDIKLFESMKSLRSHGIIKNQDNFEYPAQGSWSYEQQTLGFNYRLTDIQAALGISQLTRLDEIISMRKKIFNNYKSLLKSLPVEILSIPEHVQSALHLMIIRLKNKSTSFHKSVFEGLRKEGIGVQIHYIPVHLQPYYRKLGFKKGDFPEAELYSQNALSLPIFPLLSEQDQVKIVETLSKLIKR